MRDEKYEYEELCIICGHEWVGDELCECGGKQGRWRKRDPNRSIKFTRGYNTFYAEITCVNCCQRTRIRFLGEAGWSRYDDFEVGEIVFPEMLEEDKEGDYPRLRGISSWDEMVDRDFWVYARGNCTNCSYSNLVRLEIRNKRYAGVVSVGESDDSKEDDRGFRSAWGLLE